MTARNEHTGDIIKSRAPTQAYKDGWDRIFGKKDNGSKQEETRNEDEAQEQLEGAAS